MENALNTPRSCHSCCSLQLQSPRSNYCGGQLVRYAKPGYGHVNIDQNPIEGNIRPTKIGAKNWLHIGHPKAGWRSAVIYSVVGTCRLLKVDPLAYLTWVLPKLAAATNKTANGLLPHDYARLHPPSRPLNTS